MNDQIEQAARIYAQSRDAGLGKQASKEAVYAQLPGFRQDVSVGEHLAPLWGNIVQRHEAERKRRAPGVNGVNSVHAVSAVHAVHAPTLFPDLRPTAPSFQSALDFIRWLFVRWADRNQPIRPGDCFIFSPKQCADIFELLVGKSVVAGSFANEFLPSQAKVSQLRRAGWEFEIADGSTHECYTVRITAVPRSPAVAETPPAANGPLPGLSDDEARQLRDLLNKVLR